uniref:Activator of basal transcription 1 n=1 Tax=Panstrongylus megistus TaxID=65343 RepID=A0A069DR38_9HEMI
MDSTEEQDEVSDKNEKSLTKIAFESDSLTKKRVKTGVVYLSFIPPYMTADILRRMLSKYAQVGRIFIQVIQDPGEGKRRKSKEDTMYEGWVEFIKKRRAKEVASILNNTKMGGKKKSKFYDCLWNIKYLPRFKWVHLMERLNYERAVMKQKLRAEISQAKRIANHFKEAVESQEYNNKRNRRKDESMEVQKQEETTLMQLNERFKQKDTKEIKGKIMAEEKRENFLKSLFS